MEAKEAAAGDRSRPDRLVVLPVVLLAVMNRAVNSRLLRRCPPPVVLIGLTRAPGPE
ncbi:MAG: hypothetical protein NTNFB02_06570 [Nitrospira sp.]